MRSGIFTSSVVAVVMGSGCVHEVAPDEPLSADGANDASDTEQAIRPDPFWPGDPASGGRFAVDISFWEGTIAQQEMDCFWDSGVRHVVAGTQLEEVTRQQLAMAVRRGMTVDAYVYLYWDRDMREQVERAFAIARDFPIGRMWLDVEENPGGLGAGALADRVQQSVDACRAHVSEGELDDQVECGIYTGPGFWRSYMANTARFADVPLWYAWYNDRRALASFEDERFGGWTHATAKQWAEVVLCGVGSDSNTMLVDRAPTVIVDRTVPPDDGALPAAPTDLEPASGSQTALESIKLSAAPVPHARRYQFALERLVNGTWRAYFTWTTPNAFRKVSPTFDDARVRFRVRASKQASGTAWGAWSAWSTFDYGVVDDGAPPPADEPATPPATPPTTPPTTPNASGLTPDGETVTSARVDLRCAEVNGAARYRFVVETVDANGTARPYYTYEKTAPLASFWPQTRGGYRFAVRTLVNGAWSEPSAFASFTWAP